LSAETKIVALLKADASVSALIADRIDPDILPENPIYPAITYSEIFPGAQYHLSGPSTLSNPQIQIDCWALTRDGAKDLAAKVKTAIDGASTIKGLLVGGFSGYESDTEAYRVSMDFSIWNRG